MKRTMIYGSLLILLCGTETVLADGFQIWPQDAKSIGTFGAGVAATADDASTTFYNPAGLTQIKRQDGTLAVIADINSSRYKGQATVDPALSDFTKNSGTVQGGDLDWLPTIFYVAPISKKWGFGLSLTSPFNLDINYGTGEFTRYSVTRHEIDVYDLSAALGYQLLSSLSIGAGIDVQHLDMQFNRIDNNTTSIANDQLSKNNLTDWATGWNAGMLWEPLQKFRIGLQYRSQIIHRPAGKSEISGYSSRARTRLVVPPSTTLSLFKTVTPALDLLGTVNFTQWHNFESFVLKDVISPTGPYNITVQNHLSNTWLFALGARYRLVQNLTLRGAFGYDQGFIENDMQRLSIPDSDRYIVSLGLGYQYTSTLSFDIGYLHSFFKRSHVDETQSYGFQSVTNVGNFDLANDMIGFQINWYMT